MTTITKITKQPNAQHCKRERSQKKKKKKQRHCIKQFYILIFLPSFQLAVLVSNKIYVILIVVDTFTRSALIKMRTRALERWFQRVYAYSTQPTNQLCLTFLLPFLSDTLFLFITKYTHKNVNAYNYSKSILISNQFMVNLFKFIYIFI